MLNQSGADFRVLTITRDLPQSLLMNVLIDISKTDYCLGLTLDNGKENSLLIISWEFVLRLNDKILQQLSMS